LLDHEFVLRRALSDRPHRPMVGLGWCTPSSAGSWPRRHWTSSGLRVVARWSRPPDLTDALEDLGRQVVFHQRRAERELDEVEDELFRFGRILDREPALAAALADRSAPPARRAELLDSL